MAEHPLPLVIAKMWGREEVPRHGPRPSLETSAVVDAAISLADEKGLAGVTMSAVASKLGVAAMSLYRYVGSKDELLTMMVDAAAPEPPARGELGWRDYAAIWTRAQRDHLCRRPWALSVPRTGPPVGPHQLRWLEAMLAALEETRLSVEKRVNIATVLSGYAVAQAEMAHHLDVPADTPPEKLVSRAGYSAVLREVLDPREYPILAALARVDGFGDSEEWIGDADFDFGLNLLCAGVDSLIENSPESESAS